MLPTAVSLLLPRNWFVRVPAISRLQCCCPLQESYYCLWLYGTRCEVQWSLHLFPVGAPWVEKSWDCNLHDLPSHPGKAMNHPVNLPKIQLCFLPCAHVQILESKNPFCECLLGEVAPVLEVKMCLGKQPSWSCPQNYRGMLHTSSVLGLTLQQSVVCIKGML